MGNGELKEGKGKGEGMADRQFEDCLTAEGIYGRLLNSGL